MVVLFLFCCLCCFLGCLAEQKYLAAKHMRGEADDIIMASDIRVELSGDIEAKGRAGDDDFVVHDEECVLPPVLCVVFPHPSSCVAHACCVCAVCHCVFHAMPNSPHPWPEDAGGSEVATMNMLRRRAARGSVGSKKDAGSNASAPVSA